MLTKANEDYEINENASRKIPSTLDSLSSNVPDEEISGSSEASEAEVDYKMRLLASLQIPSEEVQRKTILQRVYSKKLSNSYQLGNQLSRKWSTGAGPRLGCVHDYPVELRLQALELTNLYPSRKRIAALPSPLGCPSTSEEENDN